VPIVRVVASRPLNMPDASGIDITATVADSMPASYADTGAAGGGGYGSSTVCDIQANKLQTAAACRRNSRQHREGGSAVLLLFPATCCGWDVLEASVKYMT
jgi:hypothetical protein